MKKKKESKAQGPGDLVNINIPKIKSQMTHSHHWSPTYLGSLFFLVRHCFPPHFNVYHIHKQELTKFILLYELIHAID